MLRLFEQRRFLFRGWQVEQYEELGGSYRLRITAVLVDGSRLIVRDYLFTDGKRKYAYQWMEANGALRLRWDNAPHWPEVATTPHHMHEPGEDVPAASSVTNVEDLLTYVQAWLESANP